MRILVVTALAIGMLAPAWGRVNLAGRVLDENGVPVAGASVSLKSGDETLEGISDTLGAFTLSARTPGVYVLRAGCEGFFELKERSVNLADGTNEITLELNHVREVLETVDVNAGVRALDVEQTTYQKTLTGADLLAVPYPATNNLRSALRIIPGIVQDSRGGIHINGATEDQVQYTLDGFNVGDPLTGRFESRMSVESVRTVEVYSGRFSAEFGKGSAGTLAIRTTPGDDKLRYSGTNFIPGIEDHKGWVIGNWTPRFNLSGPIVKGRIWLSDTIDARYDQLVVEEIPKGSDRTSSWRASNLLRGQANLTPSNLLYAGFLTNYYNAPRSGLTALDPLSTTVDRRSRQWFVYLKDQIYLKRSAIIEFGIASNRTFGREIPQGWGPYLLTVEGRRGNHFLDAIRGGGRDQIMANAFLPPVLKWGRHQIKVGFDLDRVSYSQDARRSELDYFNASGQMMRRITFGGSGSLSGRNLEASSYIQDAWRVRQNLTLEFGLRQDWDSLLGGISVSPRQGFAWAPFGVGKMKISGGYSKIYDATSLRLFTRSLDQYQLTTEYRGDGTVRRGPAASLYSTDGSPLSRPSYHNWSLGTEQMLGAWMTRVQLLHRRGADGFTYSNTMSPAKPAPREMLDYYEARSIDAIYGLTNYRRDEFDSLEFIVRRVFHKQYEWMASYTWSRAFSNAVLDVTVDDPTRVLDNVGRMPWDSPHRLMSWGLIPLPVKNWSLAYLLDCRTGFPFSVQDDAGTLREAVNSRRFPAYLEPNVHLEKRFAKRGHNWAFRFGFNNVTGKRNPTVVDNNVVSPTFLHYYGGQGRSLNFRLRWLGRAK